MSNPWLKENEQPKPLTLKLRLLTPLWTGNIDKNSNEVVKSGIIGSMRWWFEGLVRGLGGYACDPTANGSCELNAKKAEKNFEEALKDICPACRIFGCTGLRRSFDIEVEGLKAVPLFFVTDPEFNNRWWLNRIYDNVCSREQLWTEQPDRSFKIIISLNTSNIDSRSLSKKDLFSVLHFLISDISSKGGLGPRTQHGFGQVQLLTKPSPENNEKAKQIIKFLSGIQKNSIGETNFNKWIKKSGDYFNTSNMFSDIYEVTPPEVYLKENINEILGNQKVLPEYKNYFLPISFDIRYRMVPSKRPSFGLRMFLRKNLGVKLSVFPVVGYAPFSGTEGKKLNKSLFNEFKEKKWASAVYISHPYFVNSPSPKWILKVWGYHQKTHEEKGITLSEFQKKVREYFLYLNNYDNGWNQQMLEEFKFQGKGKYKWSKKGEVREWKAQLLNKRLK